MCCLYFQVNDVKRVVLISSTLAVNSFFLKQNTASHVPKWTGVQMCALPISSRRRHTRSEKHTSELQSLRHLVCRLLLEKKKMLAHPRDGAAQPLQLLRSGALEDGYHLPHRLHVRIDNVRDDRVQYAALDGRA